jgi:hypothetical protein
MSTSETTTDHDTIRTWAEERGGRPATVTGTETGDEEAGILRIDFQDPDDRLEEISWDDWFAKFEEENLAFLYQDEKKDGETSTFFKLVKR